MSDINMENQLIRLNSDIDIHMNVGDFEGAIPMIDKAIVLSNNLKNLNRLDNRKYQMYSNNIPKLENKKMICEAKLGIAQPQNAAPQKPSSPSTEASKTPRPYNQAPAKNPQAPKAPQKEEPQQTLEEAIAELNSYIGMQEVKDKVNGLIRQIKVSNMRKAQGMKVPKTSYHLVFTGNPGTGKTSVARILGSIYRNLGILSKGQLIEVKRGDLVAEYVGQTAPKTMKKIEEATGGILFIDEAYTLTPLDGHDQFGQEAVDTLLPEMENRRDDLVVIVAGYQKQMQAFIDSNPGLQSRFKTFIDFADYSGDELYEIFAKMNVKKNEFVMMPSVEAKMKKYFNDQYNNRGKNWGNARSVRNTFEEIFERQCTRLAEMENPTKKDMETITDEDIEFLFK